MPRSEGVVSTGPADPNREPQARLIRRDGGRFGKEHVHVV
jgi:hypothetical protein